MTALDRTAYPQFKEPYTSAELRNLYTPTLEEITFVQNAANSNSQKLTLLVWLKCCQSLGYIPRLQTIPAQVVQHVRAAADLQPEVSLTWARTNLTRSRQIIHAFLDIRRYAQGGRELVTRAVTEAAHTMSDPADLINLAIELLVQQRYQLPAFSTLDRLANHVREQVHQQLYAQINARLTDAQRQQLEDLLRVPMGAHRTPFNQLKAFPQKATLTHVREWEARLDWLEGILDAPALLTGIANSKIKQFAAHAHALEVGDMLDVKDKPKRYTLLLCLLYQVQIQTRDQLVTMFLKRLRRIHNAARDQLRTLQDKHRAITENMVETLHDIVDKAPELVEDAALGRHVRQVLTEHGGVEALAADYQLVSAYHNNNYLPLLWNAYQSHRQLLLRLSQQLQIQAATQDRLVLDALHFIQQHQRQTRDYWLDEISLDFASERWVNQIRTTHQGKPVLDRRMLEVCVFSYVANRIRSGDLYVAGSEEYADYRAQLLPWPECEKRLAAYCEAVGLPTTAVEFVQQLRQQLTDLARKVDQGFPQNSDLGFDKDGKPHLKRMVKQSLPEGLGALQEAIRERMPERHLLDILKRVHYWVSYAAHFGPPSGAEPKLADAVSRYLMTIFAYGCNMGPAQLARHARGLVTLRTLNRLNDQHINTAKLELATRDIINEYVRFRLPFFWGRGKAVITDGTQFELRENSLLAERHVRYGGYGGIAYHHISDTYIALFSHFIACGVWEAVYIIDGLLKNESDIQPDTVHADTQGQSESVFGLAHLLGIQLMPRMRTWNKVAFYRPDKDEIYQHIDSLFTRTVDWPLIETHWQDLMQVILSIQAGTILPSTLMQRLGSHSRQSKLYQAFAEVGRVVRTLFLLEYISNTPLREHIVAETIKIEAYNGFIAWIYFGGDGTIMAGDPVEQEKRIKYLNLVANAIMLQNVADMTDVLHQLAQEGFQITQAMVSRLSPYLTEHIKRFGEYLLDMETIPEPLQPDKEFLTV
jgi:TnpA family transposase